MKWEARKYQLTMADKIINNKSFGLFADMGLGKTVALLTAFNRLKYDHLETRGMLVVAPLRVIKTVWPEEIRKWDHLKHLRIQILHGRGKLERLKQKADVYAINYEGLQWLYNALKDGAQFASSIDMIVFDESTFVKSVSTIRSKVARTVSKKIPHRVIMTGTPTPNNMLDLWHQVYLLDQGERLGTSLYRFKQEHFYQGGYSGYEWKLRRGHQEEIQKKIQDITITLASEDYLELPPAVMNEVYTEFDELQKRRYQKLEREFFLQLETGEEVEAFNAAALSMKLRQYVQGFLYGNGGTYDIHKLKLNALREIRDHTSGNILVGIQFKYEAEMIKKEFGDVPVINSSTPSKKSIQYIKDWNAGKIPMLVGHPASMGHGLNLQSGGSTIVWFGLGFNLGEYLQMNKRLHRPGQQGTVMIHHILMKGTIDEAVYQVLKRKSKSMHELLEALKEWKYGSRGQDRKVSEGTVRQTRVAV